MTTLSRIIILSSFCMALPFLAHAQDADPDLARMVDVFSAVMRSGPIADAEKVTVGISQKIAMGAAVMAKGGTLLINSPFGVVSWGQDGKMKLHTDPAIFAKGPSRPGYFKTLLGHKRARKTTKDLPALAFAALTEGNLMVKLRHNEIGFAGKSYTAKTRPLDVTIRQADRVTEIAVAPNGRIQRTKVTRTVPLGFASARPAPKRSR